MDRDRDRDRSRQVKRPKTSSSSESSGRQHSRDAKLEEKVAAHEDEKPLPINKKDLFDVS